MVIFQSLCSIYFRKKKQKLKELEAAKSAKEEEEKDLMLLLNTVKPEKVLDVRQWWINPQNFTMLNIVGSGGFTVDFMQIFFGEFLIETVMLTIFRKLWNNLVWKTKT